MDKARIAADIVMAEMQLRARPLVEEALASGLAPITIIDMTIAHIRSLSASPPCSESGAEFTL